MPDYCIVSLFLNVLRPYVPLGMKRMSERVNVFSGTRGLWTSGGTLYSRREYIYCEPETFRKKVMFSIYNFNTEILENGISIVNQLIVKREWTITRHTRTLNNCQIIHTLTGQEL